jgi:hypothetical protein
MANTIKLKRGSGSDPSASDLAVGEVAVRTDEGKLFTKKDDGTVAEISGGGGIDDGDKGDITVSNSGATFTIDSGVITNAKISGSAAIAGSKISPSFTSDITIAEASPSILFSDVSGSPQNPDYRILVNAGKLEIYDETNSATRFTVNSDGHVDIAGNLDVGAGIDVTGTCAATTFSGSGASLTSIPAGQLTGTINDARIPDVITPATLVSTIELRTSNGQQLVLNAGESAGKISGQTGEYIYVNAESGLSVNTPDSANANWVGGTASDQTLITGTAITIDGNTVFHQGNDGAGSGLDADTLDGIQGSAFLRSNTADTMTGNLTMDGNILLATGHVVQSHGSASRDKFRVWNNAVYAIGMDDAMSFGGLNDYAMTFQMNNDGDRGFVFLDSSHTDSQGAMSLTTNGKMCVAHSLRLAYGESDTTAPGETYRLDVNGSAQFLGSLTIGDGSAQTELLIKKADNNVSDHLQFYNGTTRMGEIGCEDTTWLRINQETNKNIYTPRIIRADGGFQVDGSTVINGSGSYVRALSGASDYSSLLRSDAADTASGDITFSGGAGAATIAGNSDIRFTNGSTWTGNTGGAKIQLYNNVLYISHGPSGLVFRENTANRWILDGNGHFRPAVDSNFDLGSTSVKVRVGYFDELDTAEVRVNNGILEVKSEIAASHTLTSGYNAMAVDPTVNSGVTVTVPSGAVWAIV